MAKNFSNRPSGSRNVNEPKVLNEVLNEYLRSDEPLAVALRKWRAKSKAVKEVDELGDTPRLFSEVYAHTEPCVDLKLITCSPGRMREGEYLDGIITRDGEDHFSFVENDPVKRKRVTNHRNPRIYVGRCINVIRQADGTKYPTFNRPRFTESFTFQDFCREAARELIIVSGLVGEV